MSVVNQNRNELGVLDAGLLAGCIINCTEPVLPCHTTNTTITTNNNNTTNITNTTININSDGSTNVGVGVNGNVNSNVTNLQRRGYHVTQSQYPDSQPVPTIPVQTAPTAPSLSTESVSILLPVPVPVPVIAHTDNVGVASVNSANSIDSDNVLFQDIDQYKQHGPQKPQIPCDSKPDTLSTLSTASKPDKSTDAGGGSGSIVVDTGTSHREEVEVVEVVDAAEVVHMTVETPINQPSPTVVQIQSNNLVLSDGWIDAQAAQPTPVSKDVSVSVSVDLESENTVHTNTNVNASSKKRSIDAMSASVDTNIPLHIVPILPVIPVIPVGETREVGLDMDMECEPEVESCNIREHSPAPRPGPDLTHGEIPAEPSVPAGEYLKSTLPASPTSVRIPMLIDDDGWMSSGSRDNHKPNTSISTNVGLGSGLGCDDEFHSQHIPAPTVEKQLLLNSHTYTYSNTNTNTNTQCSHHSFTNPGSGSGSQFHSQLDSSASGTSGIGTSTTKEGFNKGGHSNNYHMRDVRLFKKNFVRMSTQSQNQHSQSLSLSTMKSMGDVVVGGVDGDGSGTNPNDKPKRVVLYRIGTMDKVYPKETERDLQVCNRYTVCDRGSDYV